MYEDRDSCAFSCLPSASPLLLSFSFSFSLTLTLVSCVNPAKCLPVLSPSGCASNRLLLLVCLPASRSCFPHPAPGLLHVPLLVSANAGTNWILVVIFAPWTPVVSHSESEPPVISCVFTASLPDSMPDCLLSHRGTPGKHRRQPPFSRCSGLEFQESRSQERQLSLPPLSGCLSQEGSRSLASLARGKQVHKHAVPVSRE